jgi:predicted nucleic acid-binding protein
VARETFVDATAWVAIADRGDQHHEAAVAIHQRLLGERRPLVTTNLVVAEAHVLILRRGGYQAAMSFLASVHPAWRLLKVYADAALEAEAEALLGRYDDQDFSLADAVSFVVMRQRKIAEAFAFDSHFATAGFTMVPTP